MVTKKPKGLGRGLEALLGPKVEDRPAVEAAPAGAPSTLPLDQLVPGQYQPRTRMDEGALYELAESIKAQGIMQPILVRKLDEADAAKHLGEGKKRAIYEIIAGERRWRAARIAGLEEVPVVIREVADQAALAMALIENIQREGLNPLEEATGIQRLIDEFKLTHQEAADAIGRSRTATTNLLRLLNLKREVQNLVMDGRIDMGHARALLSLAESDQIRIAHQVADESLSVRQTEALVAEILTPPADAEPRANARAPRDIQRLEEELSDQLGTTVELKQGAKGSGRLVLHYMSLDHLDELLAKLRH